MLDVLEAKEYPERIITDKPYDSDKHDAELKVQAIDLIVSNCKNRKKNVR